jgi:hypothetical protein
MSEQKNILSSTKVKAGLAISGVFLSFFGCASAITLAGSLKDKSNITETTDRLSGLELYTREALMFSLPNNVKPTSIILNISEGKAGIVTNPNPNNNPFYNTIVLTPQEKGFEVSHEDNLIPYFHPNTTYNALEITKTIRQKLPDLAWITTEFIVPKTHLFISGSSQQTITKIDAALNQSATLNFDYNGPSISLENTLLTITEIKSGYSESVFGPIVYNEFALKTLNDIEISLNVSNQQSGKSAYLEITVPNTRNKTDTYGQGIIHSISMDPDIIEDFINKLKISNFQTLI